MLFFILFAFPIIVSPKLWIMYKIHTIFAFIHCNSPFFLINHTTTTVNIQLSMYYNFTFIQKFPAHHLPPPHGCWRKLQLFYLVYANRSCPVCSALIFIFGVRSATHNSGKFALTNAAGIGGHTALPHRRTCSLRGYVLPV